MTTPLYAYGWLELDGTVYAAGDALPDMPEAQRLALSGITSETRPPLSVCVEDAVLGACRLVGTVMHEASPMLTGTVHEALAAAGLTETPQGLVHEIMLGLRTAEYGRQQDPLRAAPILRARLDRTFARLAPTGGVQQA